MNALTSWKLVFLIAVAAICATWYLTRPASPRYVYKEHVANYGHLNLRTLWKFDTETGEATKEIDHNGNRVGRDHYVARNPGRYWDKFTEVAWKSIVGLGVAACVLAIFAAAWSVASDLYPDFTERLGSLVRSAFSALMP